MDNFFRNESVLLIESRLLIITVELETGDIVWDVIIC